MDPTCPFCSPAPDSVFHQGTHVLGIWDRHPVTPGHALLLTRRHVASWFDATPEEQAELLAATHIARTAIESRQHADGYNIGINDGTAAGQTIPHLHVHLIPRRTWDTPDPRGGVRHVIPERGNYLAASEVREAANNTLGPHTHPDRPAIIGGPDDPLLPHLVAHLDRACRAELLVAFVLNSGVDALEQALHGFLLRGGQLRLLTGDYLDVTEPRALSRLLDLVAYARSGSGEHAPDQIQLRVYESAGRSFHPKSYIFHFTETPLPFGIDPDGIAYVGSSNLSRTALGDGIEWNYSLVIGRDRVGFQRIASSFEALFRHPRTRALTPDWIEAYRSRRPVPTRPVPEITPEPPEPPPLPHEIQRDALAALDATRQEGNAAGLVVMATGLGKTWLAAFDVQRFGSRRVLFVAHREEILRQSLATFRRILPDASFGLYTGQEKAPDAEVLFASIQSLGRRRHLDAFAPTRFDYIVVDEFHHADAPTYRRLIEHFRPSFLLGLTATPERTDGGNLLALCGENLVYRCELFDAIRRSPDRLVPFHYFGIPDQVDYTNIPWRNRRFDPEELTSAVATRERADNALHQWRERAGAGSRTLGFCCSLVHADFMAEHFRAQGVRAAAIHSGPSSAPRATSLAELAEGKLDVIFAVDILNEGVDLPSIDTVLMLRPTESRIVFLQQLGRGLRASEGKTHLTVVDYIGNHKSFLMKPQVLLQLGPGDEPTRAALDSLSIGDLDPFDLPAGCELTYELEAIQLLRDQLRAPSTSDALLNWYLDFEQRTGRRPLALDAFHEGRNPRSARRSNGSWLRFVAAQGGLGAEAAALLDDPGLPASFLSELEVTSMSKSFKMVLLLAMMRAGHFPGSIGIRELSESFAELVRRSARLRAEVNPDLEDLPALARYLETNPIQAWCKPQGRGGASRTYFQYENETLSALFDAPASCPDDFRDLVRELAEWRLADHLGPVQSELESGLRIVCKVMHTHGTPILKLPDRAEFDDIPQGPVEVLVDGKPHVADFVKFYVNVIRESPTGPNVLGDIAWNWFGPDAGKPGTSFFVAFNHSDTDWTFTALAPGEANRPTVDVARKIGSNRRVIDAAGKELDATYSIEEVSGETHLIYHSGGGTGGTAAARNTEYAAGLERLLQQLRDRQVPIEQIELDTRMVANLPRSEKVLTLRGSREYPLDLSLEPDLEDLRKAISAAQGNNPNRRIRINLGRIGGDPFSRPPGTRPTSPS